MPPGGAYTNYETGSAMTSARIRDQMGQATEGFKNEKIVLQRKFTINFHNHQVLGYFYGCPM